MISRPSISSSLHPICKNSIKDYGQSPGEEALAHYSGLQCLSLAKAEGKHLFHGVTDRRISY